MNQHRPSVALVTGAAKRIGRAIALRMARDGHDIAVHYGNARDEAEVLADEIRAMGRKAATFRADLADNDAVGRLLPAVMASLGPVTALVNNASLFEDDRVATVNRDSWQRHLDVNTYAPLILSQAFAAALPPDRHGAVINIIDQRVWRLTPRFLSYTVSKAALWTLTLTLAQALAPRIRVNAVGPGPTLRNARQDEADFAHQQAAIPLGRGPKPDEIADAVAYLVGAGAVTGQMIAVDGGQHLAWQTPDVHGVRE